MLTASLSVPCRNWVFAWTSNTVRTIFWGACVCWRPQAYTVTPLLSVCTVADSDKLLLHCTQVDAVRSTSSFVVQCRCCCAVISVYNTAELENILNQYILYDAKRNMHKQARQAKGIQSGTTSRQIYLEGTAKERTCPQGKLGIQLLKLPESHLQLQCAPHKE